ncbi:MAG: hypothetical protein JSR39_08600 [Verrucomicrobia bacterium]|nr:hypothetical protein [Verrucomicrobiota bacterium]
MSATIYPAGVKLPDGHTISSLPLSKNWDLSQVESLFQQLGGFECSDDHIVVRCFTWSDRKKIEALAASSHLPKETFSIVKHSQCYVNRSTRDYLVLSCSKPVFSSEGLSLLRETIDQHFFLPAAVKGSDLRFFAPDILHVDFNCEWPESDIENWAGRLGLSYYPHCLSCSGYKSAVVYLSGGNDIVSAFEQIQRLPEIASVRLHELPDPEFK